MENTQKLIYGTLITDKYGSNYEFTNYVDDMPQSIDFEFNDKEGGN